MKPKNIEKVINFEDKNIKYILLDRGTYLIDGELITVDSYNKTRVKVKNSNDVRIVKKNVVIDYYLNQEDNTKMTISEYNDKIKELYSHRTYENEWDENGKWNTLEDEYNYKKFKETWQQITKNIQSISDPILVEEVKTTYDTGNNFIKNAFLNGNSYCDLFVYLRDEAWLNIVEECFNELGMKFSGNCNHYKTENKKIWGNSTHSCIRYVVAFGTFVFDNKFKEPSNLIGTLDDMKKKYEEDRGSIRKIIISKYNKTFGQIDKDKIDFKKLLNDLDSLRRSIDSIDSKKATLDDKNRANSKVNKIIECIEESFK